MPRLAALWLTPRKSLWGREKILRDNDVLLAEVSVDPMYRVTLTNDQQKRGRKALLALALSVKEHEKRNLRADEVDEIQSFSKDESLISGFNNENFELHFDQQAKRRKIEYKKNGR